MNFSALSLLDIIFIIIALLIITRATFLGFLEEIFSTASWVLGLLVSFIFYKQGAQFLRIYFGNKFFLNLLSFLLLFLITYLIVKIVHIFLSGILLSKTISSFDHALGFVVGVLKAVAIILFITFILHYQAIFDFREILNNSLVLKLFAPLLEGVLSESPNLVASYV